MESFAINGVVQAEYGYDPQGMQIIRRLTQQQKTIHNVFDIDGNRIADYEIDDLTGASTLPTRIRVDGRGAGRGGVERRGVLHPHRPYPLPGSALRSNVTRGGRPVFATDDTGAVVWTVSYLPFGGVHASTGTPTKILRAPPVHG